MKRRLILILLLLMAGAIINVAAAWGCVIFNPSGVFYNWQWMHVNEARGWPVRVPADWPAPSMPTYLLLDRGIRVQCVYSATHEHEVMLYQAGRPCQSMAWHTLLNPEHVGRGLGHFDESGSAWNDGMRIFSEKAGSGNKPVWKRLPLRPIWPGFAINTVLYAALLWLLFVAPFALRRRRRIKRGLCPNCAYDLRGSPHPNPLPTPKGDGTKVCPECGTTTA